MVCRFPGGCDNVDRYEIVGKSERRGIIRCGIRGGIKLVEDLCRKFVDAADSHERLSMGGIFQDLTKSGRDGAELLIYWSDRCICGFGEGVVEDGRNWSAEAGVRDFMDADFHGRNDW